MKAKLFITLFAIVILFGVQTVSAEYILGMDLREHYTATGSYDLGPVGHGLYGHGGTFTTADSAPGGFSTESALCTNASERFWGVTGTSPESGSAMTFVIWLKADSALMGVGNSYYAFSRGKGNVYSSANEGCTKRLRRGFFGVTWG